MLSEYFIDLCITSCCSIIPSHIRQQKDYFENIKEIVQWYKKEVPEDSRPLEFRDKIDLLLWLSTYRSEKAFDLNIMLATLSNWKLGSFVQFLKNLSTTFDEEKFFEMYKIVLNRKKLCKVINGKSAIQQLLSDIDSCTMTDDEEVIEKWENQLTKAHDDLIKIKKIEDVDAASSLDVLNDSYSPMFNTMIDSVSDSQILKTGFKYLENMLVTGGFENRRLYLIGGSSGVGKSTMLINLICNAIKNNTPELADEPNTFLYITAENLIDETWIRFYCCLTGETHRSFIDQIRTIKGEMNIWKEDPDCSEEEYNKKLNAKYSIFQNKVAAELNNRRSNVIFKYVPSGITTTKDILSIVDTVSREHNLRAVFIDYLDLFSTGRNLDLRFELAAIAQSMKNISIDYNVPLITATQLNRAGYDTESEPKLTQMGESMEKVNKSDFVLFLQEANPKTYDADGVTYRQLRMTVLKQRNGKTGDTVRVSMQSTRGSLSLFNFRILEKQNPNIVEEQKNIKQNTKNKIDGNNTVSRDEYFSFFAQNSGNSDVINQVSKMT